MTFSHSDTVQDTCEILFMLYPVVRLLHNTELCRGNITNSDYPSALHTPFSSIVRHQAPLSPVAIERNSENGGN